MTVTHEDVQRWLDSYITAWRTYDPASIGDLFAQDAEYRYHPWDEPIRGRAEIVRAWVAPDGKESSRDHPGTWDATVTAGAGRSSSTTSPRSNPVCDRERAVNVRGYPEA